MKNKNQMGRSMIEMLGVLAVIGVLSIGALAGFQYAMNKHRANETIHDVMLRAMNVPMIDENYLYRPEGYEWLFAGLSANGRQGTYYNMATLVSDLPEYVFKVEIPDVPKKVCRQILAMNPTDVDAIYVEGDKLTDMEACPNDLNAMTFYFDEDWSNNKNNPIPPAICIGSDCKPDGTCSGPDCTICVGKDCDENGTCVGKDCHSCTGSDCGPDGECEGTNCTQNPTPPSPSCIGSDCNPDGTCSGPNCTICVGTDCDENGNCVGPDCVSCKGADCGPDGECIGSDCDGCQGEGCTPNPPTPPDPNDDPCQEDPDSLDCQDKCRSSVNPYCCRYPSSEGCNCSSRPSCSGCESYVYDAKGCVIACTSACDATACEVCQNGVCESTCLSTQYCDNGMCKQKCTSDCDSSQCLRCEDGACVSSCTDGEECINGGCVSACGPCEERVDGTCQSTCSGGQTCQEGVCGCPPLLPEWYEGACHRCLTGFEECGTDSCCSPDETCCQGACYDFTQCAGSSTGGFDYSTCSCVCTLDQQVCQLNDERWCCDSDEECSGVESGVCCEKLVPEDCPQCSKLELRGACYQCVSTAANGEACTDDEGQAGTCDNGTCVVKCNPETEIDCGTTTNHWCCNIGQTCGENGLCIDAVQTCSASRDCSDGQCCSDGLCISHQAFCDKACTRVNEAHPEGSEYADMYGNSCSSTWMVLDPIMTNTKGYSVYYCEYKDKNGNTVSGGYCNV